MTELGAHLEITHFSWGTLRVIEWGTSAKVVIHPGDFEGFLESEIGTTRVFKDEQGK